MKKFIKWKILIATCFVCLASMLIGIILWDKLPQSIAIHFDINGIPDRYASKAFAVFGLPLLMVLLQIICCIINDINAKKFGDRPKLERATKWIIPIMTILLQGITFMYALDYPIDIRRCVMIIVGGVLLVIGNYLPKLDHIKNYNADTIKARKINRFIGFETVIMGILAIATIFMPPIASVVWLFGLILYGIIGVVYGVVVGKR